MSLYGNIKRIGSQSFQFDRVYPNRVAMDSAATTDGVYPGRYVLVEYGDRYTGERKYIQVSQSEEFKPSKTYYVKDNNGDYNRVNIQAFEEGTDYFTLELVLTETETYKTNRETDLKAYINVYDSTVWQKVYTRNLISQNGQSVYDHSEKYVMVAELNALAPKMDLEIIDTATLIPSEEPYIQVANNEEFDEHINYYIKNENNEYIQVNITEFEDGIIYYKLNELYLYYGENNERLHNVGEIEFNKPYFDEIQDTELTYVLRMPKPLELEVNKDIDYHQEKFDIYHTHDIENAGGNFIGWKPKPENGVIDDNVNGGKRIENEVLFSKQELNMYLPAFGDVLGALYDVLFGKSSNDEIRPYFSAEGLSESDLKNTDLTAFDGPAKINDILANNTQGLAGVLKALFTDSTLPGKVRYYLSSDWLAKNTSDDSNIPGILNKPRVIFENKNSINALYNSHYTIDYTNWCLSKIYSQLYTVMNVKKLLTAPNDINKTASQANQDAIEIKFNESGSNVIIRGNSASLNSFTSTNSQQNNAPYKWIGIVLECNDRITNIKWGEYQLTEDDVAESASINLDDNCIIFWVKVEDLLNSPKTITLTNKEGQKQNVVFTFEEVNS